MIHPIALTTGTMATATIGTIVIKTVGTTVTRIVGITETKTAGTTVATIVGTMDVMTSVGIIDARSSRSLPIRTTAQISIGTVRKYNLRATTT